MTNEEDFADYYSDDPIVAPARRKFKLPKHGTSLFAIAVGAYLLLGNTLAANITLNSSSRTEFGQGVQITVACAGNNTITVTPRSTFVNASGAGAFYLGSVVLSGIPSSCYGVKFVLNVYNNSSNTPLDLFGNSQADAIFVDDNGTFSALTGGNGMTVTTNSSTSTTLTFDTPIALSSNTMKITLQSMPYSAVTSTLCDDYLASTSNTTIAVSGGTCVVSFTSSTNTFTAPTGVKSIEVLVVAGGGGGGGGAFGGGGGAGGLFYDATYSTTPGQQYSISVGAGGNGGVNSLGTTSGYADNSGKNGSNSVFGSLTAIGGGGGGGYVTPSANYHTIDANSSGWNVITATILNNAATPFDSSLGKTGGSGGGTSENSYRNAAGTSGQGKSGGTPRLITPANNGTYPFTFSHAGAGGGGAGAAGADVTATDTPTDGGAGLQYSISGSATYYAAGGGGGTDNTSGTRIAAGGSGIGGAGGKSGAGGAGTANTGSGGGGAGFNGAQSGGAGGSGIVIIRFNP